MRFPPANIQLRRAQLVLMLAIGIPTVAMTGMGVVLLAIGSVSATNSLVFGVLVLTLATSGITGFVLVSVFVQKGASLVRVQNDFVSSVSHELRTPLTSIHLLLDSLRDNRLEAADREQAMSLLVRETGRLEELVGRVLELSRLQAHYIYARETIDVADLARESVEAFDALTLTAPTRVEVEVEPGLTVVGDRRTLVRALVNLLTNAWKYTGPDKRIRLIAHTNGRRIELLVRDNGSGIAPAEQRAIFEQFSRGRAAAQSGAAGIGLGLTFVRAIVRGHRGKLDFESAPGQTTFRIRLKRRKPRVSTTTSELAAIGQAA